MYYADDINAVIARIIEDDILPRGKYSKIGTQFFAELTYPGFLRNPGTGGDIIPPTPVWAPFLVQSPETGTLKSLDGGWWVDETYFHGRPVYPGQSIMANIEAPPRRLPVPVGLRRPLCLRTFGMLLASTLRMRKPSQSLLQRHPV